MPDQLPDDIKMQLVDLVGAYLRHTPTQDLPKQLRRLAGFRPKALARHSDQLIALLDDEVQRKLILQALDDDSLRLPKPIEAVGRIALERPEDWEERIAGMSELPDEPAGEPARDYEAELLRERRKTKSAREEARKAKASARAEVEREQRKVEELQRELGTVAARLEAVTAERDLARAEVERVRDELRRVERRVQRAADKAKLAEERARAEAKALRKEVARLGRELDAVTVAPGRRALKVSPVDATPGTRTALRVPKGLFAESPETLDSWLKEPNVSLLIDGYNVSKTESGFGSLSLEDQRTRLIDEIARLARTRKVPATIVFDGAVIEPGTTRRARRTVKVAYSKPPEVADDHLVALLDELPRYPVIVVTDDRELQDRCTALGATIARAEQLLSLIR